MATPAPPVDRREFPARLAAVADTAAFALAFCQRHGIGTSAAMRLRLIVEELFTNSVRHGYGGDSDATVRIELTLIDGFIALAYEDSAPRYDPLARLSTLAAADMKALDRPPADLGTFLIGKLAAGAHYEYAGGCNRLRLVMQP
ncbi:MAG: ATP-binding protein [Burkholderiales bacterium]